MTPENRRRWVFLADPDEYGWAELLRDGATRWDGVTGAPAQKHLRACQAGDAVLLYHTAAQTSKRNTGKALVGAARVVSAPYADPGDSARMAVDVEPVAELVRPLPLAELRQDPVLAAMGFVKMPRVAVQPITVEQWDRVLELSGTDPGTAVSADPAEAGGP
jgi:predicted RNA-binding protein with PUA-like domain